MQISGISGGGMPNLSQIHRKIFSKADANGDGSIDKSEFANVKGPNGKSPLSGTKSEEIFSKIDTNADGKIDTSEHEVFGEKISSQMQAKILQLQESGFGEGMRLRAQGSEDGDTDFTAHLLKMLEQSDQRSEKSNDSIEAESEDDYVQRLRDKLLSLINPEQQGQPVGATS